MVSRRIVCRAGRSLDGAYDGKPSAVATIEAPTLNLSLPFSLSPMGWESDSMYPVCLFGVTSAAEMRGGSVAGPKDSVPSDQRLCTISG